MNLLQNGWSLTEEAKALVYTQKHSFWTQAMRECQLILAYTTNSIIALKTRKKETERILSI